MIQKIFFFCALCLSSQAWAASLSIDHAELRLMPPNSMQTAAYVSLHNDSKKMISIVSISSNIAKHTSIHQMSMHKGIMSMQAIDQLRIPAQQTVRLQAGGMHIMLMGLKKQLHQDDKIAMRFHYDDQSSQEIIFKVIDMR